MDKNKKTIRVLYSFPNKLGAQRICYTAWQQVIGLAAAGAEVTVFTGGLLRPVPDGVTVHTTLARGKLRIPYKLIGSKRAMALHDSIVSRRIKAMASEIDIVHTWPQGALRTIEAAKSFGIPTVLERCNAHTRFSYEVVRRECERLGVSLPNGHESAFNEDVLRVEEEEFRRADRLLCPSEFVAKTFLDRGFSPGQLARHTYGFDEKVYYPSSEPREPRQGLTMLFVGVCAVRKGVHYALEAWLKSSASETGTLLIAGEFLPAYAEKLKSMLSHPSVHVLGHRNNVPELMRQSDILVLPSLEEGYALVIAEAIGSGCVPLASEACTESCRHMDNGLVHRVGDVDALSQQISMLHEDRALLHRLREASVRTIPEITWTAAGVRLLQVYRETIAAYHGIKDDSAVYTMDNSHRGSMTVSPPPTTATAVSRTDSVAYEDAAMSPCVVKKYVLISPVRDEEAYIAKTIDSVVSQTVRPAEWIIIDDGSRDDTGRIIDEYALRYPWIVALHRTDRGHRLAGAGVMEAFYSGYERLRSEDWEFIGKLDGDVILEPEYFETCLRRFTEDAKLGLCGGVLYCEDDGQLKLDRHPENHVRGALKFYRRSCWNNIGGLIKSPGWDTVDEIHANMLGWHTKSFSDLKAIHNRPNGAAAGAWNDSVKNGRADYVSGYHPAFIVAKCAKRLLQKPYGVRSFAHAYGYLSGYAGKAVRIGNKDLVRYIRNQQIRRMLFLEGSWK
ncbi:glycosyltransferase involved in cell wall biosynthesis [Silvibacterium bohemicum]|uniref:Glycosyltransferase involved in cell wall biosynthesis n=1 Tax=Silvibacterium bohemicum TaxID=1577686 RepID=A0A841JNN2_9BACT|nr:glycosyltransferase [Silvibacterium bohemicum]MBB6142873.1 glycosyltransferase involved in cell wall biosynthesis [Silvibacterium bohemicum]